MFASGDTAGIGGGMCREVLVHVQHGSGSNNKISHFGQTPKRKEGLGLGAVMLRRSRSPFKVSGVDPSGNRIEWA